jgi:hypothetical protein
VSANHFYAKQVADAIEMVPRNHHATLSDNKAHELARAYLDLLSRYALFQHRVQIIRNLTDSMSADLVEDSPEGAHQLAIIAARLDGTLSASRGQEASAA